MAVNKRKHPRVRARGVAANLRAQEALKTGCVVENISAGGLLVRTDQPLEPGTPVVMDLVRPGMKKLLKLSGRVVGRAERAAGSPATVPGVRVQFDPMPEETNERLQQLLRDLGLIPEPWAPAPAPTSAPAPTPAAAPASAPAPSPTPAPAPAATAAPAATPAPVAPPRRATPPPVPAASPSAPFGPPFVPAELQQITWAPPEGLDATRAMSMEAVQTALAAAELTPPGGTIPPAEARGEAAQAALAPPPILPMAPAPAAENVPWSTTEGPEVPADGRLMVQIRGLLMELGEVQNRLDVKDRETGDLASEVERLRRENQELRERLARAEEQLRFRDPNDPSNRF